MNIEFMYRMVPPPFRTPDEPPSVPLVGQPMQVAPFPEYPDSDPKPKAPNSGPDQG